MSNNVKIYEIESDYQHGKQKIEVLVPDNYNSNTQYSVLYALPVECTVKKSRGDGLQELKKLDIHNRMNVIIVQMSFHCGPWFGDHPEEPKTRQASYITEFIIPFIENHFTVNTTKKGRILLGFSKSAYGALSLILKYPDTFGFAALWDAPYFLDSLMFDTKAVFGTTEAMQAQQATHLIKRKKTPFINENRLVLAAGDLWGEHNTKMHQLLDQHEIKHHFMEIPGVSHNWNKEWLEPVISKLTTLTG